MAKKKQKPRKPGALRPGPVPRDPSTVRSRSTIVKLSPHEAGWCYAAAESSRQTYSAWARAILLREADRLIPAG